jgi:type I restriction-modification system DNA methylase subunit
MADQPTEGDVSTDVSPIVENLEAIQRRGHSHYRVFRDWVDLMLYALQRDDEQYLEVLDRYDNDRERGEREADLFAAAFGELQAECARTGLDVLGDAYEQFGMQSDRLGQHFTPHAVAHMLASLQFDANDETVSDPACGSGRLLLYAGKRNPDATYHGQDKDAICAKMTALNLCLFNLEGYAVHGDTLLVERRNVWRVASTPNRGALREVNMAERKEAGAVGD